jgi:predicted aldo/keto reductase-like oxidoreductase
MSDLHENMDRRSFIKVGALGAAAAVSGLARAQNTFAAPAAAPTVERVLRKLGRTGLKITTVSMGAMRTGEVGVLRAAFDMGVNYVDTARVYMGGRNEKFVGQALKGYRDTVYVATKVVPGTPEAMRKSIKASLAALGLKHVDILQLHGLSGKAAVLDKAHRDVLAEARQQEKTRFLGITCHKNEADTLNALADDPDKFFDVVLVAYNFNSKPGVKEAIARAAKAGIGVIAMKTQAGGYKTKALGDVSPHQAALKFVLQNPNVTAAIPAMADLKQVKEDLAVMNMKFDQTDLGILERYQQATADVYCHRCGACTSSCRANLDIAHINRCLMYADGYGDQALARLTYAELAPAMRAGACDGCAECTARCVNGLNIAERMQRAREVFA